jgi:hypothetical protein
MFDDEMNEADFRFVLVTWPESQNFMDAPGAYLVMDEDAEPCSYMVPVEIYENFHQDS